jgi:hypothetical protein
MMAFGAELQDLVQQRQKRAQVWAAAPAFRQSAVITELLATKLGKTGTKVPRLTREANT